MEPDYRLFMAVALLATDNVEQACPASSGSVVALGLMMRQPAGRGEARRARGAVNSHPPGFVGSLSLHAPSRPRKWAKRSSTSIR